MRFNTSFYAILIGAGALTATAPAIADGYTAVKSSAAEPVAAAPEPARGPCYVRADIGYGWSANGDATATISPIDGNGQPLGIATGRVGGSSLDDSWFGEVGFGCSIVRRSMVGGSIKDAPVEVSTPTGLRGDVTFGFHGSRSFKGVPVSPPPPPAEVPLPPVYDPVHASVRANTLMFNLYYDLAQIHGFTPYVGAGIGMAFIDLKNTTFSNGSIIQLGDASETNLAWSLMAGVATDIGRGIMLDVGYRYLNMGDIAVSDPSIGYALKLHDLSEHQVKVGVRIPLDIGR